jgi:deazaflavin-dependent oxidoreductase (nitroreductase family)
MSESPSPRYVTPTTPMAQRMGRLFNSTVASATKMGISLYGSRVLYVRGRKTGEWRSTPVNPLSYEGKRYLVSPRGHTQWVRNMRTAGGGELRVGRRVERFTATELPDDVKPALLREYLRRWKFEVGMFFEGVGPDASDERLREIAPGYPVFQITTRPE